jgi:hypothetical protein
MKYPARNVYLKYSPAQFTSIAPDKKAILGSEGKIGAS